MYVGERVQSQQLKTGIQTVSGQDPIYFSMALYRIQSRQGPQRPSPIPRLHTLQGECHYAGQVAGIVLRNGQRPHTS